MSDDWRFFMCQMGEHLASILVDVGVAKTIDSTPSTLARLRLVYKRPSDNGLPTDEEFDAVVALEKRLEKFAAEVGDAYVGRLTTQGHRHFHIYTSRNEKAWNSFVHELKQESGYLIGLIVDQDPERSGYWKELYPTPDDWRVIHDMAVVAQLRKSGDDQSIHRQIDHWIYFPTEAASHPFVAWATADRFVHDAQHSQAGKDGRYCVRLHHIGPAEQRNVSNHTLALTRKAKEFGGEYDGWETSVEKSTD